MLPNQIKCNWNQILVNYASIKIVFLFIPPHMRCVSRSSRTHKRGHARLTTRNGGMRWTRQLSKETRFDARAIEQAQAVRLRSLNNKKRNQVEGTSVRLRRRAMWLAIRRALRRVNSCALTR